MGVPAQKGTRATGKVDLPGAICLAINVAQRLGLMCDQSLVPGSGRLRVVD